jgi:DNA-binding LytR/AlgR family response regulator
MNIPVAICEDMAAESEYLKGLLRKWEQGRGHQLHLSTFISAERFWTAYEDGFRPALLFLDVEMPGQNGIALAKKLRQLRDDTPIVFITGYSDYMSEGYDVAALHYLLKPVSAQALERVLDRALGHIQHQQKFLLCSVDGMTQKIYFDEIQYIDVLSHTVTIHGAQDYSLNLPIRELEQKLGSEFCRCHRSYLVNLAHIRQIKKAGIVLDTGIALPLSRRLAASVNQAFFSYYREEAAQ